MVDSLLTGLVTAVLDLLIDDISVFVLIGWPKVAVFELFMSMIEELSFDPLNDEFPIVKTVEASKVLRGTIGIHRTLAVVSLLTEVNGIIDEVGINTEGSPS